MACKWTICPVITLSLTTTYQVYWKKTLVMSINTISSSSSEHMCLHLLMKLAICKTKIALHYIIVINVFNGKNFNHFTRLKSNWKDEFSVDVWKQVVMWQIWFLEEACSRQRRLRLQRRRDHHCRTSGSWNGKWRWHMVKNKTKITFYIYYDLTVLPTADCQK